MFANQGVGSRKIMVYTRFYQAMIFFYVGLWYCLEILNISFNNIICVEYNIFQPSFLRTTIFVQF